MASRKLELTFAILKPHITKNPVALCAMKDLILTSSFNIVRHTKHRFTFEDIAKFYNEHRHKFFYNRLATFMTSGPSELFVLAKHNAIKDWRTLIGPTKIPVAELSTPESLRGQFGLTDTRNAAHGSDSPESAVREINIMFPNFDIDAWYTHEEPTFRENQVEFSKYEFVHRPVHRQIKTRKL